MHQKLISRFFLIATSVLKGAMLGQVSSYYPLVTEPSWTETAEDESFFDGNKTRFEKTNLLGFDGSKYIVPVIPEFRGTTPVEAIGYSDGGDFDDPFETYSKTDYTVDEEGITQWKSLSGSLNGGSGQGAASVIFQETSTYTTLGLDTSTDGIMLIRRIANIGEIITTRYLQQSESTSHHPDLGFSLRTINRSTIEHRAVYAGTESVSGLYPGSNPVLATGPYSALVRVTEATTSGTTATYQIVNGIETELEPTEFGPTTITTIEWVVKGIGAVRFLFAFGEWLDPIINNSIFNNGSNVVGVIPLEELIPENDIFSEHLRASGGNLGDAADTILTQTSQAITLWPVPLEAEYVFETNATDQLADAAAEAGLSGDDLLPAAIPYNDRVPNILKFAFNMDLASADSHTLVDGGHSGLPSIKLVNEAGETELIIEYIRRKNAGLIYTPVFTPTLSTLNYTEVSGTESVIPIDVNLERVSIQMPITLTDPNSLYARVKVEY